jgi:excisionase family DNA binding protein
VDKPRVAAGVAATVSSVATPRFLQLSDVAEILNCSASQVYALVRNEELPAVKIGGRGQWRVEASMLEEYIARMYQQTQQWVKAHPYGGDDDETEA